MKKTQEEFVPASCTQTQSSAYQQRPREIEKLPVLLAAPSIAASDAPLALTNNFKVSVQIPPNPATAP